MMTPEAYSQKENYPGFQTGLVNEVHSRAGQNNQPIKRPFTERQGDWVCSQC